MALGSNFTSNRAVSRAGDSAKWGNGWGGAIAANNVQIYSSTTVFDGFGEELYRLSIY